MTRIKDDRDTIPEEDDGYIYLDEGRWHVTLGGKHAGDYADRELAEYELARAMHTAGLFPTAWIHGDHGDAEDISEDINDHFDSSGQLKPWPGHGFQTGDQQSNHPDGSR